MVNVRFTKSNSLPAWWCCAAIGHHGCWSNGNLLDFFKISFHMDSAYRLKRSCQPRNNWYSINYYIGALLNSFETCHQSFSAILDVTIS